MKIRVTNSTSFISMGFPCEHILKILTHLQKEKDIMLYVKERWFSSKDEDLEDQISEELKMIINKEKNPISIQIEEEKDEELKAEKEKNEKGS